MRNVFIALVSISFLLLSVGCSQNNLNVEKSYRDLVISDFNERFDQYGELSPGMAEVMQEELDTDERFALQFIYAYMPLSDLADYKGDFNLTNVRMALRAKSEMPWGKTVPADIFLHFVLPQRVNNENLDSFRLTYYDEISDRISGIKDIGNAALEINHWCHEKVSYQSSDIRTSAPLSTILSARGRCGEESTFTVAALRCAGIPARQVYTPRWAHSDDNHAWVEVWIDGEWKYLGACEPEPVLDRGWFTEPARRAMLIHTKVFGAYRGNENTIFDRELYSEVNNLAKYAVTKDIEVKVMNGDGSPAESAMVEFQLYNYAEFYPLATVPADKSGTVLFRTGLGDLIIWARQGEQFDFKKISVSDTDTVVLVLSDGDANAGRMEIDLYAPLTRTPFPGIPAEMVESNASRLKKEDSIRNSYIKSWISEEGISSLSTEYNLDLADAGDILGRSMGNWREIAAFLREASAVDEDLAMAMLQVVSDKDLRDTPAWILLDHLKEVRLPDHDNMPGEIFYRYVLNPRIANEIITPWRSDIKSRLKDHMEDFRINPESLSSWLNDNIVINNTDNYYKVPVSPGGVLRLEEADEQSLKILFVAICRTIGIPARLEPGTMEPQYYMDGKWFDSNPAEQKDDVIADARVILNYTGQEPVPEYYIHFTIARFENGRYNTLSYPYNKKVTEFTEPLNLEPGRYMLVTGNRLDDTRVLSSLEFFTLKPGKEVTIDLFVRAEETRPEVLGSIDFDQLLENEDENSAPAGPLDNGVVIAWVDKGKEPTIHILNDLPLLRSEFNKRGVTFLFISSQEDEKDALSEEQLNDMPERSYLFQDPGLKFLSDVLPGRELSGINFPYIIYADTAGNILFRSEGYRIGIGEQILKRLR